VAGCGIFFGMVHDLQAAMAPPLDGGLAAQALRVRRYLRFLGAGRDVVDDLMQDTLLAAVRTFGSGAESPLPWLLTTARHVFCQHLRRAGRRREVADLERFDANWQQQVGEDGGDALRAALTECLRTLPGRTREALDLRYRDGAPREAIAAALGIGTEGVKSLLARAREVLADCMRRRIDYD
jgi:RNA polymerase sigma-70 factor (ECF subfamily)